MKLLPKFNIEKEENYQTIVKNFYLKENFFLKYLKKNIIVKSCPVCNSNDLQNFIDQYRAFFFSDFTKHDKNTKHYFNNIKFHLNNEKLLVCKKCYLIFSNFNYDYQFFFDYMQLDDASEPSKYDDNLLSIDQYYGLNKHHNRVKILNQKEYMYNSYDGRWVKIAKRLIKKFKLKPEMKKFLEVSSYRSWALNELNDSFDAYGIEVHSESVKFSNIKFPHLKNKIVNNLFELEENNFLKKHKPFDIVLFAMCFRHFQDPHKTLKILDKITTENSIIIIDESEYLDNVGKKINSQQNTVEDFQHQFQHGKMFYYSSVHIKSLMGKYSFKLIDEYQTQDEKYPTLTQSILVFKKQENYKENFTEELLRNYQNVKIIYENQDIFSKFLPNQFLLFSVE